MESYIHLYKTNSDFTAAYNSLDYKEPWLSLTEEGMTISYNKPKLTAITFDNITWVKDVPAKGGTATKANCTFKVNGIYEDGTSVDISTIVTVTGELAVEPSTADQRHEIERPLILTASYSGFTATGNVTVYQKAAVDFSTEPLTFNILSAGTIRWAASNTAVTKTINYKVNDGGWTSITSRTGSSAPSITVNSGDKLQFRGNNAQYATSAKKYNSFNGSTALFEAEGNIMSLIYGDEFKNNSTISSTSAFASLFRDCANLVSAENLVLPATTLADGCYLSMFRDCTKLTTAPKELPATTLASECYNQMFYNCSSLTTTPELPATTLADYCYYNMFCNCSSLTTAPALPATTLTESCYDNMFFGCTSLTIAPSILPAITLAVNCYSYMFYGCSSLTSAPELPANTLVDGCYQGMFADCSSLNYIKCLATDIYAYGCTDAWVQGVASEGTFVKNPDMYDWTEDEQGIPFGWDIQDA